jgi:hypothetical protein
VSNNLDVVLAALPYLQRLELFQNWPGVPLVSPTLRELAFTVANADQDEAWLAASTLPRLTRLRIEMAHYSPRLPLEPLRRMPQVRQVMIKTDANIDLAELARDPITAQLDRLEVMGNRLDPARQRRHFLVDRGPWQRTREPAAIGFLITLGDDAGRLVTARGRALLLGTGRDVDVRLERATAAARVEHRDGRRERRDPSPRRAQPRQRDRAFPRARPRAIRERAASRARAARALSRLLVPHACRDAVVVPAKQVVEH